MPGATLAEDIRRWASELGFSQVGFSGLDLAEDERRLLAWLDEGRHGSMDWMARHGTRRSRPRELEPGTVSVISVRMDYWPGAAQPAAAVLGDPALGYVSRYALGRDYHKLLRTRLQRLADRISDAHGEFRFRCFSDSAPVLEKPLARNAGLGWIGKHTNLIDAGSGSWFFLAEMYTDLALTPDRPQARDHCGTCDACISACPTGAITAPYRLDARLCISYLTIEHPGAIPEELREPMGNRIYGCDDCQLVCPWNRFARPTREAGFEARDGLDAPDLVELFAMDEAEFMSRFEGSAIRRIGHARFIRNVAVALGNAPPRARILQALERRRDDANALIREHVAWAIARQHDASGGTPEAARDATTRHRDVPPFIDGERHG